MHARVPLLVALTAVAIAPAVLAQEAPRDTWGTTEPSAPPPTASAPVAAPASASPSAPASASASAPAPPSSPTAPSASASSDLPTEVGFSLGARVGYAFPFGSSKDVALGDVVSGSIPIGLEAGYYLDPHLYLGAFGVYGITSMSASATSTCRYDLDTSCSAQLLIFGAAARWHFRPQTKIDPWIGGSLALEVINLRETSDNGGGELSASALTSPTLGVSGGVDYKPAAYLGVGPYVEAQAGRYFGSTGLALHEWISFGVRFRTNL